MDPPQDPQRTLPDAPDQEATERIRKRRLEQLGSSSSTQPKKDEPASAAATTSPSQPTANRGGTSGKPASEPRPTINIKPSPKPTGDASPAATDATPPTMPRKQAPAKPASIEDYADKMLTHIFRATPDPNQNVDRSGIKLTYLPNLHQELQESGAPPKLSVDQLDSAILEAATAIPHDRPLFGYLLGCFKRVTRALKTLRNPTPEKEHLLKEAKRICFSNCIFALTMPELFRYIFLQPTLYKTLR